MRAATQIPAGLKESYEQLEDMLRQMSRVIASDGIHPSLKKAFEEIQHKIQNLEFVQSDNRNKGDTSTNNTHIQFITPINAVSDVIILGNNQNSDWDFVKQRIDSLSSQLYKGLILVEDEDFHIRDIDPNKIVHLNLVAHDKIADHPDEIKSSILFDEVKMRAIILSWLDQMKNVSEALHFFIREKEMGVAGQLILNEKFRLSRNTSALRKMSRKMSAIKSNISRQIKTMIQEAHDKLQKEMIDEDNGIQQLYKQFEFYDGFTSEDVVRNTQIRVPEGFIDRSIDLTNAFLTQALSNNFDWINNAHKNLNQVVHSTLEEMEINSELDLDMPLDQKEIEWVVNDNLRVDGEWERSFTKKGLYHLFMELRTPMFMLLPFMMIGSLFAALLIGVDEGQIDSSLTHDETRKEIVVITKLPSKYFPDDPDRQGHLTFIEDINKRIKDGVFERNTVTLLAHSKEVDRYSKEVKVAHFYFDPATSNLTLYPVSNRMEVIEILKDPSFKLLHQGGGNIRMGYSALFGLMAKVSDYKYLVFGGLMLLIFWYGRKKFQDYKKEKIETASKEKKSLRHMLRANFEKSALSVVHSWKSNVNDAFRLYQELMVQSVQRAIDEKVEEETMVAQEEKILSDTRHKNFSKSEKELQRMSKETEQINRDIDRALRDHSRLAQRVKRSMA